jgi:molybdopterin-guanine dinucleotide biosynthesis protein A
MSPNFSIVIQAGGESRRMGRDKGLVRFLGLSLVERIIQRVAYLADEILITTNQPEGYRFLDTPLIPDKIPGLGALGGLYTALSTARSPLVGVIACDMPFVSPDLLHAEEEILQQTQDAAIIPRHKNGNEPFHSVYRPEMCLPAIQQAIGEGLRRVDSWFNQVDIHYLPETILKKYDPQGIAFLNVNTPEQVKQAEELSKLLCL